MRNTFKVYERLKREQHIDTLFRTGKAYSVFPIRIIILLTDRKETDLSPALAGFSVPKKKFASSVKRHRIRRLMVEAWRLNKAGFYPSIPPGKQLYIFFIFTDVALPQYELVQKCMLAGLERLKGNIIDTRNDIPNPDLKEN